MDAFFLVSIVLALLACEAKVSRDYAILWRASEVTIEHSVTVSPKYYRTQYIQGMRLLREGRLQEAERHIRSSLALCPGFTNTHYAMTQVLFNMGRLHEAIEAMRAGIAHNPDAANGHLNLGMMLQMDNRHAEAVESLSEAMRLEPSPDGYQALEKSRQILRKSATREHRGKREGRTSKAEKVREGDNPADVKTNYDTSRDPAHSAFFRAVTAAALPEQVAEVPSVVQAGESTSRSKVGRAAQNSSTTGPPYLSVVVASRNDDYGGRLEERFVTHITLLFHELLVHCFTEVEVIVVEWNPPTHSQALTRLVKDGLSRIPPGQCSSLPRLRVMRADPALHLELHGQKLLGASPMSEYHAKNMGIRAARGSFVLVTNPDDVFSPELVAFLAGRSLREDTFYTVGMRFDTQLPTKTSDPPVYLRDMLARVADDGRLVGTDYAKTVDSRPELYEPAVKAFQNICENGDEGRGSINGYWDFNAGDFVLAAKSRWEQVGGYPETTWSFGIDSAILCKFNGAGLRTVALLPPCFAIHQHHRIRENLNARKVMEPAVVCEKVKKNPLVRFHKHQRQPKLWGNHSKKHIKTFEVRLGAHIK